MRKSKTYQHILETASGLFYQNGYNATGINEIIEKAGIAKATLYSNFKSKEDICVAYLELKNSNFLRDLETYCTSLPRGKEQLLGIFEFLKNFYHSERFNGCWCVKTVAEIPIDNIKIRSEIKNQKNQFLAFIKSLVTKNLDLETEEEIDTLAKQIYMLYEGGVTESHLHNQLWPIETSQKLCEVIV